jgi:glycosyltransferase involved in cell wall biosynthesis
LDSIIPQLDDDVELLIMDGASTDKTEDIVRKYAQKESRIRYVRLPAKGGVDRDYDKAVELARGEFCWFFTDDDLLKPGALGVVEKAIAAGHDLVVVNAEVRDRNLRYVIEPKRVVMQQDEVYAPDNLEGLFVDAVAYLSFIGAVVIRRDVWLSRNRESYFDTDFIHIGVIFQKPLTASVLLISHPYIIIRSGNAQWSPRSFDIWMLVWPKLLWSFADIPREAKLKITNQEPWREFKNLILHRCVGGYTIQTYSKYFTPMRDNKRWKFIAWIIARSPRIVVRGGHYLYRHLCRSGV